MKNLQTDDWVKISFNGQNVIGKLAGVEEEGIRLTCVHVISNGFSIPGNGMLYPGLIENIIFPGNPVSLRLGKAPIYSPDVIRQLEERYNKTCINS